MPAAAAQRPEEFCVLLGRGDERRAVGGQGDDHRRPAQHQVGDAGDAAAAVVREDVVADRRGDVEVVGKLVAVLGDDDVLGKFVPMLHHAGVGSGLVGFHGPDTIQW